MLPLQSGLKSLHISSYAHILVFSRLCMYVGTKFPEVECFWVLAVGIGRRPLSARPCNYVQEGCSCWTCPIFVWASSIAWCQAHPTSGKPLLSWFNLPTFWYEWLMSFTPWWTVVEHIAVLLYLFMLWLGKVTAELWAPSWQNLSIESMGIVGLGQIGAIPDASMPVWVSIKQFLWGNITEWSDYCRKTPVTNWLPMACS